MKTSTSRRAFGTLADWQKLARDRYTETRFTGEPHECLAVNVDGLLMAVTSQLWNLDDWRVSAVVSGNFVELQKRT